MKIDEMKMDLLKIVNILKKMQKKLKKTKSLHWQIAKYFVISKWVIGHYMVMFNCVSLQAIENKEISQKKHSINNLMTNVFKPWTFVSEKTIINSDK